MKKSVSITVFILIFLASAMAGCNEFFGSEDKKGTTYEAHTTKINCEIQYGYFINITGNGNYEISYDCNIPNRYISYDILYPFDFNIINFDENQLIRWSINKNNEYSYNLGIETEIQSQSFLISDLNGKNALTLSEIENNHQSIFYQYTHSQTVDGTTYINPNHPNIKNTLQTILDDLNTDNSFLIAKDIFIWLKKSTTYEYNKIDASVQADIKTLDRKTGDCDDLSVLYISLCRSAGIPARLIRGILIEESNGIVSAIPHAWAEVFVGGNIGYSGWIPVECACPSTDCTVQVNQNFAIQTAGHIMLFRGNGTDKSLNVSMAGPGVMSYSNDLDITMEHFLNILNYEILEKNQLYIDKSDIRKYK